MATSGGLPSPYASLTSSVSALCGQAGKASWQFPASSTQNTLLLLLGTFPLVPQTPHAYEAEFTSATLPFVASE